MEACEVENAVEDAAMSQFIITGPAKLSGSFVVGGSKNAVLPIMAASLLCSGPVSLRNVPAITDVAVMAQILTHLNVQIERQGDTMLINASRAQAKPIPAELAGRMRASILVLGPLLARFGEAELPYPGGDIIGRRSIDAHIDGLNGLGCVVETSGDIIRGHGKPRGGDVTIEALSVTGTENVVMAACLGNGKTTVRLAAVEPQVVALCDFLESIGARIGGINSHDLAITAQPELPGGETTVIPDWLEAATLAIAAAATGSELRIQGFWQKHNEALLWAFDKIGVHYTLNSLTNITILPRGVLRPISVRTDIFPGFPSDIQAPMAVLLTQAAGTSEIFDTVYEGRLNYLKDLSLLGANVLKKDSHTAMITGPTPLHGREVVSADIRAGATMVIAALLAEGVTTVDNIEHIDRGYERLDQRLRAVGVQIERRSEPVLAPNAPQG